MKRVWNISLAALAVVCAGSMGQFGGALNAQTTFNLGFTGPTAFAGGGGDAWGGDYNCTLEGAGGGTGAQGWSISISADNASITEITTAGSDVDALFSGGFKKSELTTKGTGACAGKNGAVSAVVLSFTEPITLPNPPATSVIAKIKAGGTIPDPSASAFLRYIDNCQGAGQPVQNNITQDGNTVAPNLGSLEIALTVKVSCCGKQANVGFSEESKSSATPYDGIVDSGPGAECSGGGGKISRQVAEGATGSTKVFGNISSENAGEGVQGWSLSIQISGAINIGGVTTAGTVVDALFAGGFKKTETIDPAKNEGKNGAVSAIVLSFTEPVTLPPTGTATVLDFTVNANGPQGADPISGDLKFFDGLRGAGQPVQNALTIGGATVSACNFATAGVTVEFVKIDVPPANFFIRGNANNDLKLNIADPIWIINEKFRAGPATACQAAADANGDGMVGDAADVVYLINHQFMGGSPPPGAFPGCDNAPPEQCAASQDACP